MSRGDKMYYTIIGDIKKSKSIKNRLEVQQHLRDILNEINQQYENELVKQMFVTLGDEFQGIFNSFDHLFEIMHKIMFHLDPIEIRFGLGIGNILFDQTNQDSPYDSDGEAWWFARDAIKEVKENEEKQKISVTSNIRIKTKDYAFDLVFNKISDILYTIKSHWTETQRKMIDTILNHYGLSDDFKQVDLAKTLDEAPSSLNEKLKRSQFYDYASMMRSMSIFVNNRG